jgi:hypothetical protein
MFLNIDDFKAQTGLEALTDDQLKTVVDLANNKTKEAIDIEKGKMFGRFDEDIKELTGIEKHEIPYDRGGITPTHIYLKGAFAKKLASAGSDPEIENKINELTEENTALKAKIKDGDSSGVLKAELEKRETLIEQLRADQEKSKTEWQKKLEEREQKYQSTLVDNAFNEALSGLKFKDENLIPLAARKAMINAVKGELLSKYKASFTDDGTLEFLDENGQIVRNADNARHPYTAKDLLSKGLESILDKGREQTGGGAQGGNKKGAPINLSGAKSQVEADEMLSQKLMAEGLAKGTPEFMAKHYELRTEARVHELPLQ